MKISIITPSYNQSAQLEQTLQSVLSSGTDFGQELEYLVIDGGSTDGSQEIIGRYTSQLAYWCSEPDAGQYAAINKGFEKSTGDIMAWLNSSDLYLPWTLPTVREIFSRFPEIQWITSLRKVCVHEDGAFEGLQRMPGFAGRNLYKGLHGSLTNTDFIQQESVFWRRELWEKIGGKIPQQCKFAADFHLWAEFFRHAPVYGIDAPLAAFRFHGESRSTSDNYVQEIVVLQDQWKVEKTAKTLPGGFATVVKHWHHGKSDWVIHKYSGEELIWLTRFLEDRVTSFFIMLFYAVLKTVLFFVRFLLWPIRRKSPWDY